MSHPLVVNKRTSVFDVYVGRPSIWGNPFSHLHGTLAEFKVDLREESIDRFEKWILSNPELIEKAKKELKGKILGCWCAPLPCHGDILAKIANGDLMTDALAFPTSSRDQFLASVSLFEKQAKEVLAPLLEEAKDIAATVKLFKIESQEDLELANDTTKDVKLKFKDLEERRTSITQPINEGLRRINAVFKPITDQYKKCEVDLKTTVAAGLRYLREEQTRKLQEVAELSKAGDMVEAKRALLETPDAVLPAGTSIREIWKYRVVDISKVPDEYLILCVNDTIVQAAVAAGAREIPGLEIYSEDSVTTRTK